MLFCRSSRVRVRLKHADDAKPGGAPGHTQGGLTLDVLCPIFHFLALI